MDLNRRVLSEEENNLQDTELCYVASCYICGREKRYTARNSWLKLKNKPCISCSNSIKVGGSGGRIRLDGFVRCAYCKNYKEPEEFHFYNGLPHGYCKGCQVIYCQAYNKQYRYQQYDIDEAQFIQLLDEQNGVCAVYKSGTRTFHIDHDHQNGNVRGILCRQCNLALGLVGDDIRVLNSMISYLSRS